MADPNMSDFYRRVERIQKARAKGYGFEAPGTLGRSHYYRPRTQRRGLLGPVLLLLAAVFLMKGLMISQIGTSDYQARVDRLRAGKGIEPLGGWVMQVDPVSTLVAEKLGPLIPPLR
ncbi:hypothetical protein [Stagnihabitans tardus]|uniref:Uncharacterized protein n=1 Tax=Stagnihabitans tardus TaxID=2699202 RepID=A0AAE5BVI8_9RHOB|nr:hypothetical protein [Stagnihabitans tardus]NBZ88282.1 hypothetical protein [Stagnihabitans tardus]